MMKLAVAVLALFCVAYAEIELRSLESLYRRTTPIRLPGDDSGGGFHPWPTRADLLAATDAPTAFPAPTIANVTYTSTIDMSSSGTALFNFAFSIVGGDLWSVNPNDFFVGAVGSTKFVTASPDDWTYVYSYDSYGYYTGFERIAVIGSVNFHDYDLFLPAGPYDLKVYGLYEDDLFVFYDVPATVTVTHPNVDTAAPVCTYTAGSVEDYGQTVGYSCVAGLADVSSVTMSYRLAAWPLVSASFNSGFGNTDSGVITFPFPGLYVTNKAVATDVLHQTAKKKWGKSVTVPESLHGLDREAPNCTDIWLSVFGPAAARLFVQCLDESEIVIRSYWSVETDTTTLLSTNSDYTVVDDPLYLPGTMQLDVGSFFLPTGDWTLLGLIIGDVAGNYAIYGDVAKIPPNLIPE